MADPEGMEDPEVSDPGALLMLMGFEGEERALEFVGFTTEGEEEEEEVSVVLASSPASSWPSWGAEFVGIGCVIGAPPPPPKRAMRRRRISSALNSLIFLFLRVKDICSYRVLPGLLPPRNCPLSVQGANRQFP